MGSVVEEEEEVLTLSRGVGALSGRDPNAAVVVLAELLVEAGVQVLSLADVEGKWDRQAE